MSWKTQHLGVAFIVIVLGALAIAGALFYKFTYLPSESPVKVCGTSQELVFVWTGTSGAGSTHYDLVEELSPTGDFYTWVSNHSYLPGTILYFTNSPDQPSNPLMATVGQPSTGSCYNVGIVEGIK
jgi:hypothetical protein